MKRSIPYCWMVTGIILTGIVALGFAVAGARAQEKGTTQKAAAAPAGNAESGKKLYNKYGCYECHGYQAQGGASGPRIAPRPLSYPAFAKYIRQPTNQMPPYTVKVLSDSELADIYAFLLTIPPPPPVKDIPLLNE